MTALTVAVALVYAAYGLIRFRRFRDGTFDLVIFDQAVRAYAHFRAPASMARGVADGISAHFLVLGDHWSPILALLAPLYWIHDGPATLVVAQAVLFALAIPPLWVFTRRLLGPGAAYFVCGAYALGVPIASALAFDFHEVAFVPVLTAVMAERFQAGRRGHAAAAAVALLMVKEDMGLLIAGYGCYLFLIKERRLGLSFMVGGVVATWLSTRVLIPAFGGSASFYWAYGQLGSTAAGAAWHVVTHPLQTLRILVTPRVKVSTMLSLVAPLGFLPLASPMVVAVVPLLLERMLATGFPSWWTADYHYDAFIVMLLLLAAVDGAARIQRLIRVQVRGTQPWLRIGPVEDPAQAGGTAEAAGPAGGSQGGGYRSRPSGRRRSAPRRSWRCPRARSGRCCIQGSTRRTPVSRPRRRQRPWSQTARLSRRRTMSARTCPVARRCCCSMAPRGGRHGSSRTPSASTSRSAHPRSRRPCVSYLKAHGYTQVFSRDGYVVLRRPEDARTQAALRHPTRASGLRGDACTRYRQ